MPMGLTSSALLKASEYLAWEREQVDRHEYFRGEVFAMTGDKWDAYAKIASLREYVLVSQQRPRIEKFTRTDDGWRYEVVEAGGRLQLEGGFEIDVDTLYEGVLDLPGD